MLASKYSQHNNPEEMLKKKVIHLIFSLATRGIVGVGLDSPDVYADCCTGFLTSIFEMAQELGRCGRDRFNENGEVTYIFHLLLSLKDVVYLRKTIYSPSPIVPLTINLLVSKREELSLQPKNLLTLLQLIV